jgi:hypothetical protein
VTHAAEPEPTFVQPNVVISNPVVRKIATAVLGIAGTATTAAVIVDGAIPSVDWSDWTTPAAKILVGLSGLFLVGVTTPNITTK